VAHVPEASRGFRWNDPAFAIEWPLPPAVISARDAAYPLLDGSSSV
jgi:dTDP-4-dehydrorhamnose 3,5-epimerase